MYAAQVANVIALSIILNSMYYVKGLSLQTKDYDEVNYLTQNISNKIQRIITSQQLLYCPLLPLCNNLKRSRQNVYTTDPYCKPCSCGVETTPEGHCPNHKLFSKQVYQSCIRPQYLMFGQSLMNTEQSYYMTTRCLDKFTDNDIIQKCTSEVHNENVLHLSLFVPVTSKTTGVTYKNIYCAICNNDHFDHLHWRARLSCKTRKPFNKSPSTEDELLRSIRKQKSCNILFEQTMLSAAKCDWGYYTTCNQTGNWKQFDPVIEQGCHGYTSLYRDELNSWRFRNIFCFMCNQDRNPFLGCGMTNFISPAQPTSFTSLIQFRGNPVGPDINRCKDGQFFDTFENTCQTVVCPPYSTFTNNSCKMMLNSSPRQIYEAFYYSTFTNRYTCLTKPCREQLISIIRQHIESKFMYKVHTEIQEFPILPDESTCNESIVIFKVTIKVGWPHDQHKYLKLLTSIQKLRTIHDSMITVSIKLTSKMAVETEYLFRTESIHKDSLGEKDHIDNTKETESSFDYYDLLNECPTVYDVLEENSNSYVQYYYDPNALTVLDNDWHAPYSEIASVTGNFYCPRLKFKIEDVIISKNELSLPIVNVKYNVNDVIRHGNYVMVCLKPYAEAEKRKNDGKTSIYFTEGILSLVCSTLSIICLIFTLTVYFLFKELRNVPGINNMILSVHLILANLFYMFGNQANTLHRLCTAIGILTHYLWLSSMMWMHCCSIHMFRVFIFMMKMKNVNQSMTAIFIYTAYVTATSVIFVTINVVYSVTMVSNVQNKSAYLGYGGDACYISNKEMTLITFVMPVGIILLSNAVLFCIVIYNLQKLPNMNSTNKTSRNNFIIYIKLTCLTGITWIFGFIYQWTLLQAFSYIFIILNASQGVFIFISFCCNARVRNMCRSKFMHGKKRKKSATQESKL